MDPIDRSIGSTTAMRVGLVHTSAGIAALVAQSLVLTPARNSKTRQQVPSLEAKPQLSAPASNLLLECVLQHTILLSRVVANKTLKSIGVEYQAATTAAVVAMNYPVTAWRVLQSADVAKDDPSQLSRVSLAFKCLARGLLPCIIYEVGSQIISVAVADWIADAMLDLNRATVRFNDIVLLERIAQAVALSLGKIVMTPFEVVHKRQLVESARALSSKDGKVQDPGFRMCIPQMRDIVREEGFGSLYRGWFWSIPEAIGTMVIRYLVYSTSTALLV